MRRERMEYFAIGLIAGAVLGLVLGVLFAPTSGRRTRRRLVDGAERMSSLARTVAEGAEHFAGALSDRVEHYLGRDEEVARRKLRELREGVQRYTRAQPH